MVRFGPGKLLVADGGEGAAEATNESSAVGASFPIFRGGRTAGVYRVSSLSQGSSLS